MKNLILLVCLICASVVFAEINVENLTKAHQAAQQKFGVVAERDGQYLVSTINGKICSIYGDANLGTGYMEDGDRKIYWEIIPIPGGVKIIIKIELFGKLFEKEIIIKFGEKDVSVSSESTRGCDWGCIAGCAGGALGCISCGTNWICWVGCAGASVLPCAMKCCGF